ncbi:hypothetical protein L581_4402 [Serratia fonticola AU-AP2C]|nr:hypothetical protein L581_4402 [Serratia fonticola AU-AP2C]
MLNVIDLMFAIGIKDRLTSARFIPFLSAEPLPEMNNHTC